MNKILLLVLLLSSLNLYSSDLKAVFDSLDTQLNKGLGFSEYDNLKGYLAWGEGYHMMAYLKMYEATGEILYLKKLAFHIDNTLMQRDDLAKRIDYRGQSNATWMSTRFTKGVPYSWIVHSGIITFPMIKFAHIIKKNSALHNLHSDLGGKIYFKKTFLDIANDLVKKTKETIATHDDQWDNKNGVYRFRNDSLARKFLVFSDSILPLNQQNALGRSLIYLYKTTSDSSYLNKVIKLAQWFKSKITYSEQKNLYIWSYWGGKGSVEDISHAGINVDFAFECYANNIVFDYEDMDRFKNTFIRNVYLSPQNLSAKVDGSGTINQYSFYVGKWLSLAAFDPDINSIILEIFSDIIVNKPLISITGGCYMYSIAFLCYTNQLFTPILILRNLPQNHNCRALVGNFKNIGKEEIITINDSNGAIYMFEQVGNKIEHVLFTSSDSISDWGSVCAGDVDGDTIDELIAMQNLDDTFLILKYTNGFIDTVLSCSDMNFVSGWLDICTGDFNNDGKDEIVAISNSNNSFYIFEYRNERINVLASYKFKEATNLDWVGISSGDFNKDGKDEFVAVRNSDGNFYMFEYNDGQIKIIEEYTDFKSESNWSSIATGDYNGDGRDEFIAHSNSDGDFYLFTYDNTNIILLGKENTPISKLNGTISSIKINNSDAESLLFLRNNDDILYIYDINMK